MIKKMSIHTREYNSLKNKGLDYYDIKRIMIKKARMNEISPKNFKYFDSDDKVNPTMNCGNCNNKLDSTHYYAEITDYSCVIFYKCPVCSKYNSVVI